MLTRHLAPLRETYVNVAHRLRTEHKVTYLLAQRRKLKFRRSVAPTSGAIASRGPARALQHRHHTRLDAPRNVFDSCVE